MKKNFLEFDNSNIWGGGKNWKVGKLNIEEEGRLWFVSLERRLWKENLYWEESEIIEDRLKSVGREGKRGKGKDCEQRIHFGEGKFVKICVNREKEKLWTRNLLRKNNRNNPEKIHLWTSVENPLKKRRYWRKNK